MVNKYFGVSSPVRLENIASGSAPTGKTVELNVDLTGNATRRDVLIALENFREFALSDPGIDGHGAAPVPAYAPDLAVFQGDGIFTRGAGLSGMADTPLLWFSFWYQPSNLPANGVASTDGAFKTILSNATGRAALARNNAAQIQLTVKNAANTTLLQIKTTSTFKEGDPARHIAVYVDTTNASGSKVAIIYVNGVAETVIIATDSASGGSIDVTDTNWIFGSATTPSIASPMTSNDRITEFMMKAGQVVDWTSAAQIAKVFAGGAPVYPGADGSLVTGIAPDIYCTIASKSAAASTFVTNLGTGGNFGMIPLGTGFNGAGFFIKNSRRQNGYGDSIESITAASDQAHTMRRYTAEKSSPPRMDINRGIGGTSLGDTLANSGIIARFNNELTANLAAATDRMWELEGGYNDIHAGNFTFGIPDVPTAMAQLQPKVQALYNSVLGTGDPFYFLGITNGGQSPNPSTPTTIYAADDEEYGAIGHLGDYTSGSNGWYYNVIGLINNMISGIFLTRFFDRKRAAIGGFGKNGGVYAFTKSGVEIDAYDTTPDEDDGLPLGFLAMMAALPGAYDIVTNATADAYDIAHGVVPSSARAITAVSGVATRQFNVHPNDGGHQGFGVMNTRFKRSIGLN